MPGPLVGFGTDIDTDALYRRIVQLERFSQDPSNVNIWGGTMQGVVVSSPEFYNFTGKNLVKTRIALGRVLGGAGRAKISFVGDSKTEGYGASTDSSGILNAFANNSVARTAALLKAAGLTVSTDSFFGTQNSNSQTTNYQTYDGRVVMQPFGGGNWIANEPSGLCLGGSLFQWTGTTGPTSIAFTPAGFYDTIEVYTISSPGTTNNLNVLQGATSLGSINQNAAAGFVKTNYTVPRAQGGVINLTPAAAANAGPFVCGVITKDSTIPAVDFHCFGRGSAKIADMNSATNPYNLLPALNTLASDLVIIEATVNDADGGTTPAAYKASLDAVLASITPVSDVILVISNYTAGVTANLDAIATQVLAMSAKYNLPVIDRRPTLGGTNPLAVSLGAMFDNTHENRAGYADKARSIAKAILTAL